MSSWIVVLAGRWAGRMGFAVEESEGRTLVDWVLSPRHQKRRSWRLSSLLRSATNDETERHLSKHPKDRNLRTRAELLSVHERSRYLLADPSGIGQWWTIGGSFAQSGRISLLNADLEETRHFATSDEALAALVAMAAE